MFSDGYLYHNYGFTILYIIIFVVVCALMNHSVKYRKSNTEHNLSTFIIYIYNRNTTEASISVIILDVFVLVLLGGSVRVYYERVCIYLGVFSCV